MGVGVGGDGTGEGVGVGVGGTGGAGGGVNVPRVIPFCLHILLNSAEFAKPAKMLTRGVPAFN